MKIDTTNLPETQCASLSRVDNKGQASLGERMIGVSNTSVVITTMPATQSVSTSLLDWGGSGLKSENTLSLGWTSPPLDGFPNLDGLKVTYADKFAGRESHISFLETTNGHKLVAKIPRSDYKNNLQGELEAYKKVKSHPNLVNVYGMAIVPYGNINKEALLMDEIQGPRANDTFKLLSSALTNNTITAPEYWGVVQFTARRLLDVTEHMAKAKIVHNDIKPNNIVFDKSTGEPVVIDLGLHSSNVLPKGFTKQFSPPELMSVSRPNATEKSDVFLVGSSLLYGIEALDQTPERKANEGIRYDKVSYTIDNQGNARHKPGHYGVNTAYTKFVASVLNEDASFRPDSVEAKLSEFLDDRFLDDDKAKAVIRKVIDVELLTKNEPAKKITLDKVQAAADLLRADFSYISMKIGMVEPMLDHLFECSNLIDNAYKQKFINSEKLIQLKNVIDKMHLLLPSYAREKELQARLSQIITKTINKQKEQTLQLLAGSHTVSDTGKIDRLNKLYSTLLAAIDLKEPKYSKNSIYPKYPKDQQAVSPKLYYALNHLVEIKTQTKHILKDLQAQETSLLEQLDVSIKNTKTWLPFAEKALKDFDANNPRLYGSHIPKFENEKAEVARDAQDAIVENKKAEIVRHVIVENKRAEIARHAKVAIDSTENIKDDMASFVPEAKALLQKLGTEPIENVELSQQRENIRQIFTVSERLARLKQEWL